MMMIPSPMPANASPGFAGHVSPEGFQTLHRNSLARETVRLVTGEITRQIPIASVPSLGVTFAFSLSNSAQHPLGGGPVGPNWRHNYQTKLVVDTSLITYISGDGQQIDFVPNGSGGWEVDTSTSVYVNHELTNPSGTIWELKSQPDGNIWRFDDTALSGYAETAGRLTEIEDRKGNTVTLNYTSGKLSSVEEPQGRLITLSYTGELLTSVTDPESNTTLLTYDNFGNLKTVSGPEGCTVTFEYDGTRRIRAITDARGNKTTYDYLATSIAKVSFPDGHTVKYSYLTGASAPQEQITAHTTSLEPFNTTKVIMPGGEETEYRFDRNGNLWRVVLPSGNTKRYFWNSKQRFLYCAEGMPLLNTLDLLGPSDSVFNRYTRHTVNARGDTTASMDPTGILTTYQYDSEGRLLSMHPGQVNFGVQGNWPESYGSEGYILCGFEPDDSDVYQAPAYLDSSLATAITNGDGLGGNTYIAENDNDSKLLDPKVPVKGPDSLHRGIGFWKQSGADTSGASFEFTINLNQAKAFNLSVYSHSADLGQFGGTADPFKYNGEFGRDIEIQVEDMNGTQSYRMHNNAPGVWTTFPVEGDASNGIKVTVTATGPNNRPVISALAFDPHEDRRSFFEYTDGLLTKATNGLGQETDYAYNPDGTLASMTDARGKITSFAYTDTHKNLTQVTDDDSNVTAMAYDDNGNVTSITDANTHVTSVTYDGKNRVLTVTDPLMRVTEFDYDGNGNILTITDPLDRVTSFTYTANNQLATVENELGHTIQIFYDENGRRKSIIDPRGVEIKFFYNEDGNLVRTDLPNGEKVTYSIDALNQVAAVTGPNGNQNSTDLINLTGAANFFTNPGIEKPDPTWPDGAHDWVNSDGSRTRELSEFASGQASLALDQDVGVIHDQLSLPEGAKFVARAKFKGDGDNLVLTAKVRDSQGVPLASQLSIAIGAAYSDWEETPPFTFEVPGDSHTTPSNFSLAEFSAFIESEVDADGWLDDLDLNMLSYAGQRDTAGRMSRMTSPIGAQVSYERDRLGRVVGIEDPKGERVRIVYDVLDRVVQVTKPSGEAVQFAYNEVGSLASFTDGRSKTTTFTYNDLNRLTTITHHDSSTESFTYDPVGNLLTYTDPKSQTKTFAYDDADRLTSITYSTDSSTVVFTYDDVDNLLTQTERNGDVVTYTYDDIDRLTSASRAPDTGNTTPAWSYSFTYDANGNRLSSNVSGSAPYGASTTGTANGGGGHHLWRVESEDALYDDNDARYGTSRYSGGYDSMNRPPSLWVGDTRQMAFEYDSESRRTGIDYANGVNSNVSFDIIGRPLGFRTEKDATELLAVDYSYDINSNRTSQVTGDDTFDYHIDEDGRLVGESINRMVTLLPRDVLAGSFEECTEQSGEVELLALDDTFSGSEFNSDRWRTGHVALFGTSTIDPDPYLGGEIRQNDGLHLVFPRGFTSRTHKRDHPLEDNYATHFGKYRLFAEHRKPLVGDFDVQVDFSYAAEKYPSSSGIELYASLNPMSEDGYNDIAGVRRVQYWYQANAGTGGHTTTDNDGKFRLVRSGSDITAYHWDSGTSSWQTYTSWTYTGYGDPVWVGLSVFTNQHSVISGSFSNFIFNDGGDTRSDAGSYISPIYDSGRTVTWGNLAWEETLPSGTDIELQVAFSDDEEGPWNFVGPDGTSGTKFTTSTGQSVYGSPSSRYCRYKAYLTGDGTDTPTLGTVELGFSGNLDSQIRTFAFDDAGNMTEKITKSDSSLIEETRTYNDLNQITQNQIDDGTTVTTWTFTHDSNGNMTSKSDGTDTYTYVWNEDNQLESVELNSSPVVDYVYDAGSRMLQRSEGSTTTNFHWDGWDLIREEKDDGVDVEVTNYLVPHGEVLAFERDDEWFYLHNDGISSTQLVTDESGAQVGRMVYGAWGETLSSSESVPGVLDVRFVGGLGVRNDDATGLIWMRHRWYDCELGRFISRDPIGLVGDTNLYRYTSNPASHVDPSGLLVKTKTAKELFKLFLGGAEVAIGTAISPEPSPSGELLIVDGARRVRNSLIALGIIGTTVAVVTAGSTPLNGPSTYSANSDLKELAILGRQQQNVGRPVSIGAKEDDDCGRSKRLALGVRENLFPFADEMDAMTYKDSPSAKMWLVWVAGKIADPDTEKLFLLEGIPGTPMEAVSRGSSRGKKGFATDYELYLVYQNGRASTRFFRGNPGNYVEDTSVFK